MSHIIINEKNFERFSSRMQDVIKEFTNGEVSLGKLQSQELMSKILGSENLHELRINLKKEKVIKDYTCKLNTEDVDKFFKKQFNSEEEKKFIEKLELRMDYIIKRIADISGYDLVDWNHGLKKSNSPSILNCIVLSYFPSNDDFKTDMKETIKYNIEYVNKKVMSYDKYLKSFPTIWLTHNFELGLMEEVKNYLSEEIKSENVQVQLRPKIK